jgi:hypothetical protein
MAYHVAVLTVRRRWLPTASLALLPLVMTLALYAPVLTLPYFWDDYSQFNFAASKTYRSLWTNATGLPYYRPLTFTINKLFFQALPFGATLLPHLFVVAGHVLAATLAGYVAGVLTIGPGGADPGRRDKAQLGVGLTAAALFAAYPFATLSVAYFSGFNHVWLVAVTLVGLVAILKYANGGGTAALATALAAAMLAPTVHEAGVVAGPLMAAGLWAYDRSFARRRWWLLAALVAASALFLPVWLLVPKSRDANSATLALGDGPEILAKLSFFLQAPSYPFQPLAALLISRLKFWDLGAIWLAGGPTVLAAGAWLWHRGHSRVVWFATAWTMLSMLPTVLALHFDYISNSQRLLYYCGPAAAVLWAVVLVELVRAGRGRAWRLAIAACLAGAALGVPLVYAVREVRLNALALAPLQQLDEAALLYPHDKHLIVNTVNWMSYRQIWYPLGHDGVTVLAPYLSLPDLIYINTGVRLEATIATIPDLLPALTNHYISTANEGPGQLWNNATFTAHILGIDHTWFTRYTDTSATVRDVGHVATGAAQPPEQFLGRFESSVYLLDGQFKVEGSVLNLTLDWLYLGPDPSATIFRNAFDCAGNVVGLGSGNALGTMLPLGGLPAGTSVHDLRAIPLDARSADGCYQVEVGLFRADGSRLAVFGMDGGQLQNQLVLISQRAPGQ